MYIYYTHMYITWKKDFPVHKKEGVTFSIATIRVGGICAK